MSFEAYDAVTAHSQTKENDRLVMFAIARYADKDFIAYPSVATIAKVANVNRATVYRILSRLVESGELHKVSGKGRHSTSTYTIKLPKASRKLDTQVKPADSQNASEFSDEIIQKYTEYRQAEFGNIKNERNYAAKLKSTGKADREIKAWLDETADAERMRLRELNRQYHRFIASRFFDLIVEHSQPQEERIRELLAGRECDKPVIFEDLCSAFSEKFESKFGMVPNGHRQEIEGYAGMIAKLASLEKVALRCDTSARRGKRSQSETKKVAFDG